MSWFFIQILRPNHPEFAAERKLTCQQFAIKTRTFYDAKTFTLQGYTEANMIHIHTSEVFSVNSCKTKSHIMSVLQ